MRFDRTPGINSGEYVSHLKLRRNKSPAGSYGVISLVRSLSARNLHTAR